MHPQSQILLLSDRKRWTDVLEKYSVEERMGLPEDNDAEEEALGMFTMRTGGVEVSKVTIRLTNREPKLREGLQGIFFSSSPRVLQRTSSC